MSKEDRVRAMFIIAQKVAELANVADLFAPGIGCTIIVHDDVLTDDDPAVAMMTSLPSRRHVRALLANVVVESAMADGAESGEDVQSMARADLAALERGEVAKDKPS